MPFQVRINGTKVRDLRVSLGYTQGQLATRTGIDRSLISHIERGARTSIEFDSLNKLARGLKVEPLELLSEDETANNDDEEGSIEEQIARLLDQRPELRPGIAKLLDAHPLMVLETLEALVQMIDRAEQMRDESAPNAKENLPRSMPDSQANR